LRPVWRDRLEGWLSFSSRARMLGVVCIMEEWGLGEEEAVERK